MRTIFVDDCECEVIKDLPKLRSSKCVYGSGLKEEILKKLEEISVEGASDLFNVPAATIHGWVRMARFQEEATPVRNLPRSCRRPASTTDIENEPEAGKLPTKRLKSDDTTPMTYQEKSKILKKTVVEAITDADVQSPQERVVHCPSSDRQFFHGLNWTPVTKVGEEEEEEEMECDTSWMEEYSKRKLMEIEDTNDGEREMMTMWNDHITSYPYQSIGFRGLEQVLREFVPKISSALLRSKDRLLGNFLLHLSNMVQGGLITQRTVLATLTPLQETLTAGRRRQRDERICKRDYLAQRPV